MYRIKTHDYEDLDKFHQFVDRLKNNVGHIELRVKAFLPHGITSEKAYEVGAIIDENTIGRFINCEIYYLDECENYPEFVIVGMNGSVIIAQDMSHYVVYEL